MSSSERHQKELEQLEKQYDLQSEKLADLRRAKIIETDPATQFKLEKQIEEVEEELNQIKQQLNSPLEGGQGGVKGQYPWNVPYPRNPYFTGREQVLQDLHDALLAGKATALAQTQAISGLGGIGKTQTAVEYAYRYRDEYSAVFWVLADSYEALMSDFMAIAELLNLPVKNIGEKNTVVAVKRWLEIHNGWLLILDNADEPELVKDFIPLDLQGHVLLTSRARVFDTLGIGQPVALEKMIPNEAQVFLNKRTGRSECNEEERDALEQLAQELDYLPLALEQAGAYILRIQCSFNSYLIGYRERRLKLLEQSRPVTGNYPESVATTWSLNFEQVEQMSEAAADLLRLSAFLYPEKIPLELLNLGAMEFGPTLSKALEGVENDPLLLDDLLEPLTHYSLIQKGQESRTYNIHRLVQLVLQETMNEATQRQWAKRIVQAANRAFPYIEFPTWLLCERLLRQAQNCAELIEKWNFEFNEAARLLHQTGFYLEKRACYSEVEAFYKSALAIWKKIYGTENPKVANSLNSLASLYLSQGRYPEAELLHKQALTIQEKVLGLEHPDVAQSLNNLAELYRVQSKYIEAESLHKRALMIREKVLGSEHPQMAESLHNLAGIYHDQGKYPEAELLYQMALAIREKTFGSEHYDVANSLNNLAGLYHDQRKDSKAEPLFKRALAIQKKAFGFEHPYVTISLNNLADLYRVQKKYSKAKQLYKRALTITENILGPEHPNMAHILQNLALLYVAQDKYTEAETNYKQSLTILEEASGPDHPNLAKILKNYAKLLRKTDREADAVKLEARAEAIRKKHAQTGVTLSE